MRHGVYENRILEVLKKTHLISLSGIHKKIPDADFSTVFRIINRLQSRGLVRGVYIQKDIALYELHLENSTHDHFLCVDCGNIEIITIPRKNIRTSDAGSVVEDVLVRGRCAECISK